MDAWFNDNPDCFRDIKELHGSFYQLFDASLARESVRTRGPLTALIGAGAHFEAWLLPAPRSTRSNPMRLVVKVSQPRFFPEKSPQFRAQWLSHLRRIQRERVPLLPPFEILELDSSVGLVMPYASERLDTAKPHWQPLDRVIDVTRARLSHHGLVLNDTIQAGCWQGIPLIYDLSDLVARPAGLRF